MRRGRLVLPLIWDMERRGGVLIVSIYQHGGCKMDTKHEEVELVEAYRGMAPEARKILLEVARRYLKQFPGRRPVRLRLVLNRNKI